MRWIKGWSSVLVCVKNFKFGLKLSALMCEINDRYVN